jgi:hypothetical protein
MIAALTACASPEEIRAADEATCSSHGFQLNTPDFATCLQRQSLARQYSGPPMAQYGPVGYGQGCGGVLVGIGGRTRMSGSVTL